MDYLDTEDFTPSDLTKGLIAGLLAGAAGTYVMTQAQPYVQKWAKQALGEDDEDQGGGGGESSTVKAAQAVAEPVLGRELTKDEKQTGSYAAHYGFGTLMGGVYGAVAEVMPQMTSLMGLPAGAALFVAADETAVPATGLSKPPTQQPAYTHLYGLVSHLIYGATVELCRKFFRAAL